MPDFHVLIPKATQNLITNPSFENDINGWIPEWDQEATFEDQELTPNPTGFDATAGVGANLDVNEDAAIRGKFGLQAIVAGVGSEAYGRFTGTDNVTEITIEFYFDPSKLVTAVADTFDMVCTLSDAPASAQGFLLLYQNNGGVPRLRALVKNDAGGNIFPWDYNLSGRMEKIRLEWKAASAPAANDGIFNLYVDDVFQAGVANLDNDTHAITEIQIGTISGLDAGTNGTIDFDNIRWLGAFTEFMGSSLERTLERARFGRYSTRIYTDGYSLNEGAYFRVDTTNINELVSTSAYIRGEGKLRIRIFDGLTGAESISKPLTINDNRWHRIEIRGRAVGGDDLRVYIETAETAQELIFYVDGVQLEEQEEATTYCDGEQQGCRWNGVSHASISERNAEEMGGGVWFPIREEGCSPDIYVTVISGFGVPPITLNRQRTASTPGSVFDSLKVEERTMQLIIWVKDEDVKKTRGLILERLHELRQTLIDLVKPDISPDTEPFMLRYTDNGKSLTIRCRYNAGLEFDGDIRNKFTNTIPLRLLALDPYWEEDNQEVALLDTENPLGIHEYMMGRINGEWQPMGQGLNRSVWTIEEGIDGRLYAGGDFTADGDGIPLLRFARMNDTLDEFIQNSNGLNNRVGDIIAHPNGRIYACGLFTADGLGNPFDRIVEYDPATDTFTALAGGIDNAGANGMDIAPNGDLYVVGSFTTVDGQPMNNIAFWDGGGWHEVGDIVAFLGGAILLENVVVKSDTEIYVVGHNAPNDELLLQWDGSNWITLYSDPIGVAPIMVAMVEDLDGTILFGGQGAASTTTNGQVLRWNGSAVTQVGEDFTHPFSVIVNVIEVEQDGLLFAAGRMETVGDLVLPSSMAIWNGSTYTNLDFDLLFPLGTDSIIEVKSLRNGDLVIGIFDPAAPVNFDGAGIAIVENIGTADVFPILTITGTGRLLWLENQTTNQRLYLDYTLQEDEIFTLDFRNNTLVITSNYRGSVPDAVLPNSDNFFLAAGKLNNPKENKIALLIIDEVEPTAQLRYVPVHWSIDAVAS